MTQLLANDGLRFTTTRAAVTDATASTGIANNADVTTVVVLKSEYDTLVTKFNALLATLNARGLNQ